MGVRAERSFAYSSSKFVENHAHKDIVNQCHEMNGKRTFYLNEEGIEPSRFVGLMR
jgi:hypothetical protein